MRSAFSLLLLLPIFTAAMAFEPPQSGDVEVGIMSNMKQNSDVDWNTPAVSMAWLLESGHQIGGSIGFRRTQSAVRKHEQHSASLLYRYNWLSNARSFFPYVGLEYEHSRRTDSFYDTAFETWLTIVDERQGWKPHVGIKFMLNRFVAFDVRLSSFQEARQSSITDDNIELFTGLSAFL